MEILLGVLFTLFGVYLYPKLYKHFEDKGYKRPEAVILIYTIIGDIVLTILLVLIGALFLVLPLAFIFITIKVICVYKLFKKGARKYKQDIVESGINEKRFQDIKE